MAYDSARGVTVVHGGWDEDNLTDMNDTWEWNGSQWTLVSTTGPGRCCGAMAYDSQRGVAVLFGGWDESNQTDTNDTWEWDGTTWTQVSTTGPAIRYSHKMAYDSARGVTCPGRCETRRESHSAGFSAFRISNSFANHRSIPRTTRR